MKDSKYSVDKKANICTDTDTGTKYRKRHKVQKKAQTKYRFKACNVQCTVHVKDTMYIKKAHEI